MESKKINQLATELAPDLSDLTIIGDPTTGISKKITLSQMASLFTGTVEEYANLAAFPLVGVADTIYVAKDTNVIYRWDSTAYVVLSPNIIASLVFNDANGFDGTIALVGSVATLTITTALTTGSVGFIGASGALLQDNANFFWDDTNNRLGLGTNAPTTALDVFGSGIIGRINGTSTNNAFLGFSSAGTNKWSIGNVQSDHRFRIYNEATTSELISVLSTGEFGIGIANPTTKFHIDGAASALIANLDANVSVAKSISYRSDNSNRINLEVSGTESGSNAGANFFLRTYTDAGSLLETPFSIVRSTGVTTIKSLTLTNALSVANGGTGSTTQNFVDLTTAQTIAGAKTFSAITTISNATASTSTTTGGLVVTGGVGIGGSVYATNGLLIGNGGATASSNYIPKFTSASAIANSAIFDNSGNIGINNTNSVNKLDIVQTGSNNAVTGVGLKIASDAGNAASMAFSQSARGTGIIGMQAAATAPSNFVIGTDVTGNIVFKNGITGTDLSTGTDRLTINSAGDILIGTTTGPNIASGWTNLSINGSTTGIIGIQIGGANYGSMYANSANNNFVFQATGASNAANMVFLTASTERVRITSGGYFKAANDGSYLNSTGTYHEFTNNTSATATTVIRNTAGNFTDNVLAVGSSRGTNSNFSHIAAYTSDFSNIVFKVRGDGNVYNVNGVYTSGVSDIKYKEQIIDANSQWEDIKNLRVVNFKFIKDVKENGEEALKHIGFIAQDVEKVSPNLIEEMTDNKTGETWKTIKTSIIHTKAIKALQEAMLKIEALEEKIKQLELK